MNCTIFSWRSLKTRITFFTLAIFFLGLWSLAFYASRMLREDMKRLLGEQQFSTVSFMAAEVNQALDSRFKLLEKVAQIVGSTVLGNPASLQTLLEKRPALEAFFSGGYVVYQLDGIALAAVPRSMGRVGINNMDVDSVAAALGTGKSSIGRPVMDKKLGTPAFEMAVPIRDAQGRVIGALGGVTYLDQPNFLDQITVNRYGKNGDYFLVAPQYQLVLSSTRKNRFIESLPDVGINPMLDRFMQGVEGSEVVVNPLGVEMLTSVKGVPVAGWYVGATLPTAESFATIHSMQQRMLLATCLLTLVAGLLTWWMLRRQLFPLLAAARTLATQSETNQPLPIARPDEIGELIAGFNHLLENLRLRKEALKESENYLRTIIENEPECIKIVDAQGRLTQMNPAGLAMIEADSMAQVAGLPVLDLVAPEYRQAFSEGHQRVLAGETLQMEFEVIGLKGRRRWLETHAVPMSDKGEVVQLAVTRDITERKQTKEKIQLAASVFAYAREGIMITTADGTIVDVNGAFSRITGYPRDEVLGQNPRILSSGRQGEEFYNTFWRSLIEEGHWYGELWNRRKDGEIYAEMQTISTVCDAQGKPQHYVAMFSDISALKLHQKQLEHIAHFDALTHLPNRVLVGDRLRQAISQNQRRGQLLAVVYLDLDGFKAINDHYGHEAGDQLLIALSARMKHALREGDTLARIGGDEFIAVLIDLADVAASVPMIHRLLAAAAQPVHVGTAMLQVSASLGITFYPQAEEVDADRLLRQADHAMYQAKLAGRNRYHIFDAEQDRSMRGLHESVERIRQALVAQEFVLHYQPKVNMRTGTVIGVEALIRWQHPEQGLLAPAVFLPVIEDHPLAIDLGEWVICTALTQMTLWQSAGLDIPVSVNIGAHQLQQTNFVERLHEILAAHPQAKPSDLELEVLETSALEDLVHVSHVIEACRQIGVMFALDDFGTGYSSLTYLKRLSVTLLKIDQSFVHDMLNDPDDLAILQGVIGLASAFHRQVIAEGVETVEQGAVLLQLGCELVQGYGIARPMPAQLLPQWAATWHTDPAWADLALIDHEDLPLLFASAEHRAWILAIGTFLKGEREAPPIQNVHQCRFAQWLEADGLARYGEQPAFQTIESLHRQVHALAAELLILQACGQSQLALARLGELHDLRDNLLAQMKQVQKNRSIDLSPIA